MFCFQCQETAKGIGCTLRGVCGKLPQVSNHMDLLLGVVRGIATIDRAIIHAGAKSVEGVGPYVVDALFSTITNANFDDQSILLRVDKGIALKKELLAVAQENKIALPNYHEVKWGGEKADYEAQSKKEGILRNDNEDLRSLKELTVLGLKGVAAYYEHATRLGHSNDAIMNFMLDALSTIH